MIWYKENKIGDMEIKQPVKHLKSNKLVKLLGF